MFHCVNIIPKARCKTAARSDDPALSSNSFSRGITKCRRRIFELTIHLPRKGETEIENLLGLLCNLHTAALRFTFNTALISRRISTSFFPPTAF